MKKRKKISGFLSAIFFLACGSLLVFGQAPSQKLEKTEGLRREIRLINLLNGLDLTPEQMTLIRDKAEASRRLVDDSRSFFAARQKELEGILEEIRKSRLENQDVSPNLAQRYHALDLELKKERLRLEEKVRGFAGEIERNLAGHQIYALEKFVPCIIPPKGESRIGQAVDVRGIAGKLARLRSVPERLYEQRRNQIIGKSVEEIKVKAGPAVGRDGEAEMSEKLGDFYNKVRGLDEVDFEIQKERLAQEFASIVKPKSPTLDMTKKIEAFLLRPEVIPILEERIHTAQDKDKLV